MVETHLDKIQTLFSQRKFAKKQPDSERGTSVAYGPPEILQFANDDAINIKCTVVKRRSCTYTSLYVSEIMLETVLLGANIIYHFGDTKSSNQNRS